MIYLFFIEKINIERYNEINQLLGDGLSIRAVATQLQCSVSTVQRAKAYQIAHKIKKKPRPRREARQSKHNFNYQQCCSSQKMEPRTESSKNRSWLRYRCLHRDDNHLYQSNIATRSHRFVSSA
ncbi:TPA: helix-turn-helix domain-containing protein [Vibrio parahaemolyticus]